MYFELKSTSKIILAITSFLFSRAMFVFIDDPEGPNLLIVTVLAAIVYFLSLAVYPLKTSGVNLKKILTVISIQVIIVTIIYFLLAILPAN